MGAIREMALWFTLSALTASAPTLTATLKNRVRIRGLDPVSRTAQTITGRVTFTPCEIMFQNGKSLMLDRGGQMPEAKKAKAMADLYKVTSLDDPVLANGKKLCKGENPSPA